MNRRLALKSLIGGVGMMLAGCAGRRSIPFGRGSESTTGTETTESGPFGEVTYQATSLQVSLRAGTSVDKIGIVTAQGGATGWGPYQVTAGQSVVTIPIAYISPDFSTLAPGDYVLVAIRGDTVVGKTRVTLRRRIKIVDLTTTEHDPTGDFGGRHPPAGKGFQATVKNTGTLPAKVQYFGAIKGVLSPNPPDDVLLPYVKPANVQGSWPSSALVITPGNTLTIQTEAAPLTYTNPGLSRRSQAEIARTACQGAMRTATLLIRLVSSRRITATATVKYGGKPVERDHLTVEYGCTNTTLTSWSTIKQ